MLGLGKRRTKLGKYLDRQGISQEWIIKNTGISRDGISDLCDEEKGVKPRVGTKQKIISSLRKHGYDVRAGDFWT
ncbi:transcriptional regulator [Paenibacillus anaericanus]|uniref:Transcriptional regulator n=1 Tax=Paenibacillus anaericanus TaxID=170367 RepID=A0A3S1CBU3_9BACL|nr:transcriptional regulator [Paenibacillus anaericanus]RUT48582.1 transcriptional regulator [Paenibacillus anaericanus]